MCVKNQWFRFSAILQHSNFVFMLNKFSQSSNRTLKLIRVSSLVVLFKLFIQRKKIPISCVLETFLIYNKSSRIIDSVSLDFLNPVEMQKRLVAKIRNNKII